MFRSLSLALRKRNVDQEKIEKIVNAIVRKLENFGDTEVKTTLIGEYIMEALSHLDQIAYVRFASVYKNFREVKDFEDFLDNLEDNPEDK
jgi:transcriptional repressor NrdR